MTKKLQNSEYTIRVIELVGNEYSVLEEYVDTRTKLLTRHNLCGFEWKIAPNKFLMGRRCPKCDRIKQSNRQRKPYAILSEEISSINNGEFSLIGGEYLSNESNIIIHHNVCERDFEIRAGNFLIRRRCNLCSFENQDRGRKTHEEFCQEIYGKYGEEYIILNKYENIKTKVHVKHSCGNDWYVLPNNLLRGYGCPKCKSSKGEIKIAQFLDKNNMSYEFQKVFPNCNGMLGRNLKFDFCIYDSFGNIFLLIEYQGIIHFKPIEFFGGIDGYYMRKCHDSYKAYWCKKNNLNFLTIDYTEFKLIDKILESELSPLLERR
jgi:hypothetical protein